MAPATSLNSEGQRALTQMLYHYRGHQARPQNASQGSLNPKNSLPRLYRMNNTEMNKERFYFFNLSITEMGKTFTKGPRFFLFSDQVLNYSLRPTREKCQEMGRNCHCHSNSGDENNEKKKTILL